MIWLRARLHAELGDPADAERRYLQLRDHFAAEQHGFHAALVCLELATLYYRQCRLDDLAATAA